MVQSLQRYGACMVHCAIISVMSFACIIPQALLLLGKTAEDLYQMKMAGDDAGYEEVFGGALFKSYVTRVIS